jgi:hypothetical protein
MASRFRGPKARTADRAGCETRARSRAAVHQECRAASRHRLEPRPGIPSTQDKQGIDIPTPPHADSTSGTPQAAQAGAAAYKWSLSNPGSSWGLNVNDHIDFDAATQQVTIRLKNKSNRCLGAYIQFQNSTGGAITPSAWKDRMPVNAYQRNPTKKYLAFIRPVDCVFGIPLWGNEIGVTFPFIEGAVKAQVLLGGMGTGNNDPEVEALGRNTTAMLNYAIPMMMIAFGVGMDSIAWYFSVLTNPTVLELFLGVLTSDGPFWLETMDVMLLLRKAAGAIPTIIFSKVVARYIAKPLVARIAGQQAAQTAPIAGWVLKIMCLTAAGGMLISTTVAANNSPGTYSLDLSRAIDVRVQVHPDPTHGGADAVWPLNFHHFTLTLKNQSGASQDIGPLQRAELPARSNISECARRAGRKCADHGQPLCRKRVALRSVGQRLGDGRHHGRLHDPHD